jgi:membrane glycosyltransferase
MGNIVDFFSNWGTQDRRILMLGLDSAGKTTVLTSILLAITLTHLQGFIQIKIG